MNSADFLASRDGASSSMAYVPEPIRKSSEAWAQLTTPLPSSLAEQDMAEHQQRVEYLVRHSPFMNQVMTMNVQHQGVSRRPTRFACEVVRNDPNSRRAK